MADAIMDQLAFHSHRIEIAVDTVRRKPYRFQRLRNPRQISLFETAYRPNA